LNGRLPSPRGSAAAPNEGFICGRIFNRLDALCSLEQAEPLRPPESQSGVFDAFLQVAPLYATRDQPDRAPQRSRVTE